MPNSSIELQFGREIIIYGGKWNIQQLSDLLVELNIQVVIAKRVSMICLKRGRSLSEGHWLGPEKLYFMYCTSQCLIKWTHPRGGEARTGPERQQEVDSRHRIGWFQHTPIDIRFKLQK